MALLLAGLMVVLALLLWAAKIEGDKERAKLVPKKALPPTEPDQEYCHYPQPGDKRCDG
jgi:hypothetical protein